MADAELSFDALLPPQMASRAEAIGIRKAQTDFWTMLALAVLAGAFIAAGALYSTTVSAGEAVLPYGVGRMLAGFVFCLGLILVIVAGAELFTGNNLIVMAWAGGKVKTSLLVRNWAIVYLGNFIGSILTALIMLGTQQYMFGKGSVGLAALNTALAKATLNPIQAMFLGIMCNALVCMAVWLCFSARSTIDKILAIIFPISAFVAAGFEHSVANMYFIPMGLLIKQFAPASFWAAEALAKATPPVTPAAYARLTVGSFFINNLIPVTIGNIIGGAGLVGLVYWFAYLRTRRE
jgi:formate/nitrite transporter